MADNSCNQGLLSDQIQLSINAGCVILFCLSGFALPAFSQEIVETVLPNDILTLPRVDFVNTADPAVPFAQEVIVDVRSAFHWSRYQSGAIGEWSFSMFPDGSAKVMSNGQASRVQLRLDCKAGLSCRVQRPDGSSYTVPATGSAKPLIPSIETEEDLATYLAEWILSGTGFPPVEPVLVETTAALVPNSTPKELSVLPEAASEPQSATSVETAHSNPTPQDDATVVKVASAVDPIDAALQAPVVRPAAPPLPAKPQRLASSQIGSPECANGQSNTPASCFGATPSIAPLEQSAPVVDVIPDAVEDPQTLFERINLRCSLTGTANLQYSATSSDAGGIGKPRGSLGCGANLTDKLSLRVSVLQYAIPSQQNPWDPDFTYAWSYQINDKINLGYANYSARFGSGEDGFLDSLKSGKLRATFKLPKVTFPNDKSTSCSLSVDVLNPVEESINLSCGYNVTDKLTVRGTVNSYFPGQQGAFDPDYSYTASYRPAEDWVISYSNYSNNRWPWNKGENASTGFMAGSIAVTYSFAF